MNASFWFSPVPPARTDIARYSARITPHLAPVPELQLVRPDGTAHWDELPSREAGAIGSQMLNASRICFYNIGNNPVFHGQILRIGMTHPGIVILHDRSLQDLCHAALRDEDSAMDPYLKAMQQWYGRPGREAARAALAGEESLSALGKMFPLFEVALHNALGVVTHNPDVADEISERFPAMPVITLPLPYDRVSQRGPAPVAQAPGDAVRLMMFGYMGPNRRLCDFLRIWSRSPWKHRFTLDLVGEIHNRAEVQAVIAETGLGPRINDHGYLPDDALDGLIGRADLVLNLRNPTMGEASGSQLRIWANGVASVVSQTGWYGRLPEGSVLRVTIAQEQEDLLNLLDDLAHQRVDLVSVAKRGMACLADCDPVAYAAALTQWLEQERDAIFARWAETALIERVARSYARCMPPHFMPRFPSRLLA